MTDRKVLTAMATNFSFDDSNAYRWRASDPRIPGSASTLAKYPDVPKNCIVVEVEKDAPYTTRYVYAPKAMSEKEVKAFVEATVAISQRDKAQAIRPPKKPAPTKTDKLGPAVTKGKDGWVLLALVAAVVLFTDKKGR